MGKAVDLTATMPLLKEWRQATRDLEAAKAREAHLREQFKATLSTLGVETGYLVDQYGARRPVLSCKKTEAFQGAAFRKARPDLAEQFTYLKETPTLDTKMLQEKFPEVYGQFQTVSLRPDWKAVDLVLGDQE